jgi:hypothetical protein
MSDTAACHFYTQNILAELGVLSKAARRHSSWHLTYNSRMVAVIVPSFFHFLCVSPICTWWLCILITFHWDRLLLLKLSGCSVIVMTFIKWFMQLLGVSTMVSWKSAVTRRVICLIGTVVPYMSLNRLFLRCGPSVQHARHSFNMSLIAKHCINLTFWHRSFTFKF